jgi:CRP-like cAMP-binding protein
MEDKEQNKWINYRHLFERLEVPAKTILLKEGEIAKYTYYIEIGCVRIWFNNAGKDITLNFFFDGEGVSSIESFRTGKPSSYYLETLEPSIIYRVEKKNFKYIQKDSPIIKSKIEEITFQQLFMYQELFLSRIKDSGK